MAASCRGSASSKRTVPTWLLRHSSGLGNSCCRQAEPGCPAEPPAGDFTSLGPLGLVFLVKYGPGISHNLCTKVRRELDEICLMTGSWDALSTGMTELSPGKRRLTRGFEGWRGEGAEEHGTQGRPPAAAMLCQRSPRPREESCKVAGLLQTPVWPYEPPSTSDNPLPGWLQAGVCSTGAALQHRAPLWRVLAEPCVQTGTGSTPSNGLGNAWPLSS